MNVSLRSMRSILACWADNILRDFFFALLRFEPNILDAVGIWYQFAGVWSCGVIGSRNAWYWVWVISYKQQKSDTMMTLPSTICWRLSWFSCSISKITNSAAVAAACICDQHATSPDVGLLSNIAMKVGELFIHIATVSLRFFGAVLGPALSSLVFWQSRRSLTVILSAWCAAVFYTSLYFIHVFCLQQSPR